MQIDWRPFLRDSLYYIFSLLLIFFVILTGDDALWYEGLILMAMYALYIVMMKFNTHLMNFLERACEFPIFLFSSPRSLLSAHTLFFLFLLQPK